MAVKLLKLTTGEEVVADVSKTEAGLNVAGGYTCKYPVRIVATREGLGIVPWSPFLKEQSIFIPESHVIFTGEVDDEIANGYNSKFGSGIVVASSLSDLVT